jgi:flavodoxin I
LVIVFSGAMAQNSDLHRPRSNLVVMTLLALVFAGLQWRLSSHGSKQVSFAGGPTHKQSGRAGGLMSVVDAAARRRGCTAREAIGLFFATQTGNTETVAGIIADKAGAEAMDAGEISAEDLAGYDGLIVGCPTWNTGADEYRSGTSWDDLLDDIKGVDLKGKPVAVFGCGDSQGYGDNFCDGIEELHETFAAAGAKMVGYVDAGAYQHAESKSTRGDKFLGLPLDQDNEDEMTEDRIASWVTQIKGEGMPL